MAFISKEEAIDTEVCWDRLRHDTVSVDFLEGLEQGCDILVRLLFAPTIPCVAIDFIKTMGGGFLNADSQSSQVAFRAMTSFAVSGS